MRQTSERVYDRFRRQSSESGGSEGDFGRTSRRLDGGAETGAGASVGHPRSEARRIVRGFGPALAAALDRLGLPKVRLAEAAGLDSATVDRIVDGVNKPSYESAVAIFRALWQQDRAEAIELGRGLVELLSPPVSTDGDWNGDGREDVDDLILSAAGMIHAADELLELSLQHLGEHGYIGDADALELTRADMLIRDVSQRHQRVVEVLHAAGARARH